VSESTPPASKPINPLPYLLLVGFGLVFSCPFGGFAAWCFYDGAVAYPAQRERALTYEQIKATEGPFWEDRWQEVAAQRGWPLDDPGKPKSELSITTQYIMGSITGTIAAGFLLIVLIAFVLFIRASMKESANPRPDVLDQKRK